MATGRPDIDTPEQPPPVDGTPGPTGISLTLAMSALFALALAIVGLVAIGTWLTDVIAVALTLAGLLAASRYVQRIAWTRRSGAHLRRGPAGMNDDLSNSDDVHEEISAHDLRPDNPARKEVEHRTG
jgi:hypothetical protein